MLDQLAPDVEVWRDSAGRIFACCRVLHGEHRLEIPELASFYFEADANEVRAVPHRPLSADVIQEIYRHDVVPWILPALGLEVLHASAVQTSRGIVVLCGSTGTGKSTVAFGLFRRGHALWADDAVALDVGEAEVRAVPLPFEIRLRPPSAAFFGEHASEPLAAVLSECRGQAGTEPAPVAAICVLTRSPEPAGDVAVRRLPSGASFTALLPHAYAFVLDAERKRRMVERYLRLVAQVPVFEAEFPVDLDRLPALLDAVESIIDGTAPGP
jgi:hypothetical protein